MSTTGARSRRSNAPTRGKRTSNRGHGNDRPDNGSVFELFSLDSVTGGGSKKIGERYYQVEAVTAICTGLAGGGRGQLRSACGTGKTVMAQRAAELLCTGGGLVVILCPSIALVAQTLREWEATTENYIALGVCSDDTIRDSVATVDDIPATVTTDADAVAGWLRAKSNNQLRLIVGTHISAHVVGDALLAAGRSADLLVVDEAHRTAGIVDKHTALVHDDARFPAVRRLYATATPKIVGEKLRTGEKSFTTRIAGMDDYTVFGPVLYDYPFAKAIDDKFLDDYRLVVMGVTRQEVIEHLAKLPRTATGGELHTSLHTAMVQTVLAKAARQYGFRRALTFCKQLNEANDFALTMKATLSALPDDMKPAGLLTTAFVHGGMSTTERDKRLQLLKKPPYDGWAVVTNVRCLSEGVDVPAIDAVAFTHPKQSTAEIVQAIGRALRRDPNGSGMATILVPILLPDNAEDGDDLDGIDIRDYSLLWQVVKALRAHDEKLGAPIDDEKLTTSGRYYYEEQPLEHVLISLPPGYDDGAFLRQLTAKIISTSRVSWWANFAALKKFHEEHGHTAVRRDYIVKDDLTQENVKLGVWTATIGTNYRKGLLARDKIQALEGLGFDFLPGAVEWAEGLRAATAFFEQHGHLEPVRTLKVQGMELRAWLDKQRDRAAAGELGQSRRDALTALRMRWHDRPKTFDEYCAALGAYRDKHGHLNIEPDPGTEAGHLGNWLIKIRIRRKMGHVPQEQIDALDALGVDWNCRQTNNDKTDDRTKREPAGSDGTRPRRRSLSASSDTNTMPARDGRQAKLASGTIRAPRKRQTTQAVAPAPVPSSSVPAAHRISPPDNGASTSSGPSSRPQPAAPRQPERPKPPVPMFQSPT